MSLSSWESPPIAIHLPGASSVISDMPLECSTSPSSLVADDEQLMRTVNYTHDGKSITFEIVNKRPSLMELTSTIEEANSMPEDNIFKRILKSIFYFCVPLKTRRAKAKSLSAFGTV